MSWRSLLLLTRSASGAGCPPGWRLSRALSEGGDLEIIEHVRACGRCGAEWTALERTAAGARALPAPMMSERGRARIAERLALGASDLSFARRSRRRPLPARRAAAVVILACGTAAAALSLSVRRHERDLDRSTAPSSLASLRAVGGAVFTRLEGPPHERVRLDEGTLELTVAPPREGRTFRVETSDAAIDAPAGRLSVQASARTLVVVRVFDGYAEVRGSGGGRAALRAGDEWTRAPTPAMPSAIVAPRPSAGSPPAETPASLRMAPGPGASRASATPRREPRPLLAPTPSAPPSRPTPTATPERASFERGWRLLRAGDAAAAAAAFGALDDEAVGGALAEDALFWKAVALARAGRAGDARDALTGFIVRFPRSARAGEASAMLGWMLLESGDSTGARRAFERAAQDRVDRVRASAQSGLARLDLASH